MQYALEKVNREIISNKFQKTIPQTPKASDYNPHNNARKKE